MVSWGSTNVTTKGIKIGRDHPGFLPASIHSALSMRKKRMGKNRISHATDLGTHVKWPALCTGNMTPISAPTPLTGSLQWRNLQTSSFHSCCLHYFGRTTIPLPLRKSPVGCCMNPPRHGGNFEDEITVFRHGCDGGSVTYAPADCLPGAGGSRRSRSYYLAKKGSALCKQL